MKGKFIVIDGTDGSGKATQTSKLVEHLKKEGLQVRVADFPQYGLKSAGMVEDYLNGKFGTADEVTPKQASIFYAIDRYAAAKKIKKWISEGKIVIANRYTSSNMGHQTCKLKSKQEMNEFLEWLEELEFNIFKIPKPDMTLILYIPPSKNQELVDQKGHRKYLNGEKRDIHEADLNHLRNASEAYKYCAKKYNWPIIDCTKNEKLMSIEEVHELVWNKIKEIIK
ncbi:MAG: thymidylate kinase [Nanoarchaeota archaeon]|nr:thymidylate kinase [Nanoarchaeota archaeon]MBU1854736.1 thymidylate kinase [Nanoarchaeota archaeon]